MKLISFKIKNFRSITSEHEIAFGDYSVIVGPNNVGKSNILQAIDICFEAIYDLPKATYRNKQGQNLKQFQRPRMRRGRRIRRGSLIHNASDRMDYDWDNDFPQELQQRQREGREGREELETTEFELKFKVDNDELKPDSKISPVKDSITYHITFSRDRRRGEIQVGIDNQELSDEQELLIDACTFFEKKIELIYIPTIRTSDLVMDVISSLLDDELELLEEEPEYKNAMEKIIQLQKPILTNLGKNLHEIVSTFVPEVKKINLEGDDETPRISPYISPSVSVDDGIMTDLEFKGDGIKSLMAISILKSRKEKDTKKDKNLVIALEEPEAHLHPEAVHKLKSVLADISKMNQLIVSTHSPILVEKLHFKNNIIVSPNQIKQANKIRDVRKSLGIALADNLLSAFLILLVEGETDKKLLEKWLTDSSEVVKEGIKNSLFVIRYLSGADNLRSSVNFYKDNVCNLYVFLDDDQPGNKNINIALKKNQLLESEYKLCCVPGMDESELEDLIKPSIYSGVVKKHFGVDLDKKNNKIKKKKWSDRMKCYFNGQGKLWKDETLKELKNLVCNSAVSAGIESLDESKGEVFNHLVESLNDILSNVN